MITLAAPRVNRDPRLQFSGPSVFDRLYQGQRSIAHII
jgi:hypothetical protein